MSVPRSRLPCAHFHGRNLYPSLRVECAWLVCVGADRMTTWRLAGPYGLSREAVGREVKPSGFCALEWAICHILTPTFIMSCEYVPIKLYMTLCVLSLRAICVRRIACNVTFHCNCSVTSLAGSLTLYEPLWTRLLLTHPSWHAWPSLCARYVITARIKC